MSPRRAALGRDEVLRGAGRVIARRGADATRFADVAAETGSAISTLQYAFGNREDLIIAAIRHTNAADVSRVERALEGLTDPVERFCRFVLTTLRAEAPEPEAREAWLVWIEYWRTAARDRELAREWHSVYEQWKRLLRPIVADGVAAGSFRVEDQEAAITQVLALFDGLCIPMVLADASMPPRRIAELALSASASILACPELSTT